MVNNPMCAWRTELGGNIQDLAQLAGLLSTDGLRVGQEGESYFLYSSEFHECTEALCVYRKASELLARIRGAASIGLPVFCSDVDQLQPPLSIAAVEKIGNDGRVERTIWETELSGRVNSRTGVQPIRLWLEFGETDDRVAMVLRIVGRRPLTWTDLYNIYETIENDVEPVRAGWTTRAEAKRFSRTANTTAAGDDSRHAASDDPPHPKPMLLDEAVWFIQNLAAKWLTHKTGGA